MKKHLLLLSLAYIAFTVVGQNSIPNGNFETWNSFTYYYPQNYIYTSNLNSYNEDGIFNVVKTTDFYHGASAVKVTSLLNRGVGYFLNCDPSNGDMAKWKGGMPYTQKPVGVRGYYKYNVATADSAIIISKFRKSGSDIGVYFTKIGGIKSTYTFFNATFYPPLTQSPDSVIFGAVSSDFTVNDKGVPGSTLFLDSVSFTGVSSQPLLMNGDFESWQQAQTAYTIIGWPNQYNQGEAVTRTSDAYLGQYALQLKTYLGTSKNGQPRTQQGYVSTGYNDDVCKCQKGGFPFSKQIDTLVFYYKYAPSSNDIAQINVQFKKNGANIGGQSKQLTASSSYQLVEMPFNVNQIPDTVIVQIQSSLWQDSLVAYVGSVLKIDALHFKSQLLNAGINDVVSESGISIYPNPSSGRFMIQGLVSGIQNIEIYNVIGSKIYTMENFGQYNSNEIDLSTSPKGIYFVRIKIGEKSYSYKILLK